MNELIGLMSTKIRTIVESWPTHADVFYFNVNNKFNGHRMFEEGVQEWSYCNPNIWFYPLEYSKCGQSVPYDSNDMPSGDCKALLESDADQGDYYAYLIFNGVRDGGGPLGLNTLLNNAGDPPIAIQKELPDWLARVFHPNINGMTAYRDAIVEAYENYSPRQAPFQAGTCHVTLTQTQEHFGGGVDTYGWKGKLYDNNSAEIEGCGTEYEIHASVEDYRTKCDFISGKVNVHIAADDVLKSSFGDQNWKSDNQNACQIEQG